VRKTRERGLGKMSSKLFGLRKTKERNLGSPHNHTAKAAADTGRRLGVGGRVGMRGTCNPAPPARLKSARLDSEHQLSPGTAARCPILALVGARCLARAYKQLYAKAAKV